MSIDMNDLRAVDLNLLVAFEAIAQSRSITRAAALLGLGQPAVSQALARLRLVFGDSLFVRGRDGMQPTERALHLAPAIAETLAGIRRLVAPPAPFDPAQTQRLFRIGLPDDQELVLIPRLLALMARQAPHAALQLRSVDRARGRRLLDDGSLDLAIGAFDEGPDWQRQQVLLEDGYECLRDPRQIICPRPIGLADFLAHGHVLVSLSEDRTGRVDEALARLNLRRRIVLSTPRFLAVPAMLAAAPLIATLPARMAAAMATAHGLARDPVPAPVAPYQVTMIWHAAGDADPALVWLRRCLADLARQPAPQAGCGAAVTARRRARVRP
jgi:DNA-binding transcriptional LysR family regulator